MRQCATKFLLDRQKEPWGEREHCEPHGCDGSKGLITTERRCSDSKERVGGDASNDEPNRNRDCSLRDGAPSTLGLLGSDPFVGYRRNCIAHRPERYPEMMFLTGRRAS